MVSVSDTDTELKYFRENIPYAFSGKVSKSGHEVGDCLKSESVRFSIIFVLPNSVNFLVTRTVKGEVMNFGTFVDREGHWIDTVHFPPVVKKYPFKGRAIYLIEGKVTAEFDFYSIEVTKCERLEYWNGGE